MSLTTSQAFAQFLTDITATDYQKDTLIPARKNGAIKILKQAFPSDSDLPFIEAHLIGSAAKGTIIRPFDDVDVLAVFSNENKAWDKYWNDSKSFLYRIRKAYDGCSIQQVGARGQAVRVFFDNGGHVDVAPVFMQGNGIFHLPSGDGSWILTAPLKANDWFSDKNAGFGYNLAPLVRMLKKWNAAHSKRLRSFHLETMIPAVFTSLGSSRQDAVMKFFEFGSLFLDVYDPGGQSGILSGYLTWTTRSEVVKSFEAGHKRASDAMVAEKANNHAEAKRLWALIFGPDFPTA